MNREYNYSELIEDYLTGNLSEKQRQEFELQLQQDPDLKKELMLQNDIITAIKEVRKAELKSMLNKINVSSTNGFNYFPFQIAGALLISSLLAIGAYKYFSDRPSPDNQEVVSDGSQTQTNQEPAVISETGPQGNETSPSTNEKGQEAQNENVSGNNNASNEGEKTVEQQSKEIISDFKASTPSENSVEENVNQPSDINVETKKDTKHAFHYQYYEDKLFLYGDFKGSKYEILKLPSSNGNKMFMSYNGKFYKMDKSRKIKAFEPVEDPAIIEQLQKLKSK